MSRSCVTITTVRPSSWCRERSSSTKSSEALGSSPAVGSSSSSKGGSIARARASATRLTMPPERSAGIFAPSCAFRPTICSLTIATSRASAVGSVLSSRRAKAMLSSTLKAENSAPCWNSMPTRLEAPRRPICEAGSPSTSTSPRVGISRPSIWRSSTVLPVPDPPTRLRISPCAMRSAKSWCTTTCRGGLPKAVQRPRMSTTGPSAAGGANRAGAAVEGERDASAITAPRCGTRWRTAHRPGSPP